MPSFLVQTDPGLESVARDELREHVPGAAVESNPFGVAGQLRVELPEPGPLLVLRTIHHVIELRGEVPTLSIEAVRELAGRVELDEMRAAGTFRVTTSVRGRTDLDRIEIQRAAGAVLNERYGTAVDLERFDLDVRLDVQDRTLVCGLQLTRDSLAHRVRRGRALRSSLRATTAAAMVRLAGLQRGAGRVIDPLCGAGTIPLEAYGINPRLQIEASDWDASTVEVACGTFENHQVPLRAVSADARALGRRCPGVYDAIVTDPPYGMRQGRQTSLPALYRELLGSFRNALKPGGVLTIAVVKHRLFSGALETTDLRTVDRRDVLMGELDLALFTLRRPDGPGR